MTLLAKVITEHNNSNRLKNLRAQRPYHAPVRLPGGLEPEDGLAPAPSETPVPSDPMPWWARLLRFPSSVWGRLTLQQPASTLAQISGVSLALMTWDTRSAAPPPETSTSATGRGMAHLSSPWRGLALVLGGQMPAQ